MMGARDDGVSGQEFHILVRLAAGEDIRSSDRPSDRLRKRLVRKGLIEFRRVGWRWALTDAGRAMLAARQKDSP